MKAFLRNKVGIIFFAALFTLLMFSGSAMANVRLVLELPAGVRSVDVSLDVYAGTPNGTTVLETHFPTAFDVPTNFGTGVNLNNLTRLRPLSADGNLVSWILPQPGTYSYFVRPNNVNRNEGRVYNVVQAIWVPEEMGWASSLDFAASADGSFTISGDLNIQVRTGLMSRLEYPLDPEKWGYEAGWDPLLPGVGSPVTGSTSWFPRSYDTKHDDRALTLGLWTHEVESTWWSPRGGQVLSSDLIRTNAILSGGERIFGLPLELRSGDSFVFSDIYRDGPDVAFTNRQKNFPTTGITGNFRYSYRSPWFIRMNATADSLSTCVFDLRTQMSGTLLAQYFRHDEMMAFIRSVASPNSAGGAPNVYWFDLYEGTATTPQLQAQTTGNFEFPIVIVTNLNLDAHADGSGQILARAALEAAAADIIASNQLRFWIHAQLHSNEAGPGEATLALIGAMIDDVNGANALLSDMTLIAMPRYNIEGAYLGNRTSPCGLDINRDSIRLITREARLFGQAFRLFMPHVGIDAHEGHHYVVRRDAVIPGTGTANLVSADAGLPALPIMAHYISAHTAGTDSWLRADTFISPASSLNNPSWEVNDIAMGLFMTNLVNDSMEEGLIYMEFQQTQNPGISRAYMGLQGAISFVTEGRGIGGGNNAMDRRVHSYITSFKSLMQSGIGSKDIVIASVDEGRRLAAERGVTFNPALTSADSGWNPRDLLPLQQVSTAAADAMRPGNDSLGNLAHRTTYSCVMLRFTMDGNAFELATNESSIRWNHMSRFRPRPTAYVIPLGITGTPMPQGTAVVTTATQYSINYDFLLGNAAAGIVGLLDAHDFFWYKIPAGSTVPLRQYFRTGTDNSAATSFTAELRAEEEVTFPYGAVVVPMDQWQSPLISQLFEPDFAGGATFNASVAQAFTGDGGRHALALITHHIADRNYPFFRFEQNNPRELLPIPIVSIAITPDMPNISTGDSVQLTAIISPAEALPEHRQVRWTTSDPTVAVVSSNGYVTAVGSSSSNRFAIITATSINNPNVVGNVYGQAIVIVAADTFVPPVGNPGVPLISIAIAGATSMDVGTTADLTATPNPSNATRQNIRWTSSNENIAAVSVTSGRVTGLSAGSVTITATGHNAGAGPSNIVATHNIQVFPSVSGVTVSPISADLRIGASMDLAATVVPAAARDRSVTWTSSNTAIATVSPTGRVNGVSAGYAYIRAITNDGGFMAYSRITVIPQYVTLTMTNPHPGVLNLTTAGLSLRPGTAATGTLIAPETTGANQFTYQITTAGTYSFRVANSATLFGITKLIHITAADLAAYREIEMVIPTTFRSTLPGSERFETTATSVNMFPAQIVDNLFHTNFPHFPSVVLETPVFTENKHIFQVTTQAEMMEFIGRLQERAAFGVNVRVFNIGRTPVLNYEFPVVIVTRANIPANATFEDAAEIIRADRRPTFFHQALIHGDELSASEGALAMLLDVVNGDSTQFLNHVNFVSVPRINPEGAARYTRSSLEPIIDMNRDHLRLRALENQLLHYAYVRLMPEVVMDGHEIGYYGVQSTTTADAPVIATSGINDIEVTPSTSFLNPSQELVDHALDVFTYRMFDQFNRRLDESFETTGFFSDLRMGHYGVTTNHAIGRAYYGLMGSVSVLVEVRQHASYMMARRSYAQLMAARSLMETLARNAAETSRLVREGRERAVAIGRTFQSIDGIANTDTAGMMAVNAIPLHQLTTQNHDLTAIPGNPHGLNIVRPSSFRGASSTNIASMPFRSNMLGQLISTDVIAVASAVQVGAPFASVAALDAARIPLPLNHGSVRWRARPTAYIIPKGLNVLTQDGALSVDVSTQYSVNYEALEVMLNVNEIDWFKLEPGTSIDVRQYYRTGTFNVTGGVASDTWFGTPAVNTTLQSAIVAGLRATTTVEFPHGAYVIPLDQVGGAVAVAKFEPDITNSNNFNASVAQTLPGAEGLAVITHHVTNRNFPLFRFEQNDPRDVLPAGFIPVTGLTLTPHELNLPVRDTFRLRATVEPRNATSQDVTWTSSNPRVVSVSDAGVATAVSISGTAVITARTVDGNFTATSVITVSAAPIGGGATVTFTANDSLMSAGFNLAGVIGTTNQFTLRTGSGDGALGAHATLLNSSPNRRTYRIHTHGVYNYIVAGGTNQAGARPYYNVTQLIYFTEEQVANNHVITVELASSRRAATHTQMATGNLNIPSEFLMRGPLGPNTAGQFYPAGGYQNPMFVKPGYSAMQFTTEADLEEFVEAAVARSPRAHLFYLADMIDPTTGHPFGGSPQFGHRMPFVIVTNSHIPVGATIEEAAAIVRNNDKPTFFHQGQIHGNEPSASEGTLAMLHEMAGAYGAQFLDRVNYVVLLRYNPDGGQINTRASIIPELDLNRDHIRLMGQESRMVRVIYHHILPEMMNDAHELGGYSFGTHADSITREPGVTTGPGITISNPQVLQITPATSPNTPSAVIDLAEQVTYNVFRGIQADGMTIGHYGQTANPAIGRHYFGLTGAVTLLIEVRGQNTGVNMLGRAHAGLAVAKIMLETMAADPQGFRQIVADGRNNLVDRGRTFDPADMVHLALSNTATGAGQVRPAWNSPYDGGSRHIDLLGNWMSYTRATQARYNGSSRWRPRPTAYIIPKGNPNTPLPIDTPIVTTAYQYSINYEFLRNSLIWHNIEFYSIAPGTTVNVRQYFRESLTDNNMSATGAAQNAGLRSAEYVTFAHGAYVIPMDQPMANIALVLFEPDHAGSAGFGGSVTQMGTAGNSGQNANSVNVRKALITHHLTSRNYPYFRLEQDNPRQVLSPVAALNLRAPTGPFGIGLDQITLNLFPGTNTTGAAIAPSSTSSSVFTFHVPAGTYNLRVTGGYTGNNNYYNITQIIHITEDDLLHSRNLDLEVRTGLRAAGTGAWGVNPNYPFEPTAGNRLTAPATATTGNINMFNTQIEQKLFPHESLFRYPVATGLQIPMFTNVPRPRFQHTTNDEMMTFLSDLATERRVHLFTIGYSPVLGDPFPVVIVTNSTIPANATFEQAAEIVRNNAMPTFLMQGLIHGGEISATEGVLAMLNVMAGRYGGELNDFADRILSRVNFVAIPRINIDGAARSVRASLGPVVIDMNRDHVRLMAPEIVIQHHAFLHLMPEVVFDGHEIGHFGVTGTDNAQALVRATGGMVDVEPTPSTNMNNPSAEVVTHALDVYTHRLFDDLRNWGIRVDHYQMSNTGWTANPGIGRAWMGAMGSISMLVEVRAGNTYLMERRAWAHVLTAKSMLETLFDNAQETRRLVREGRERMVTIGRTFTDITGVANTNTTEMLRRNAVALHQFASGFNNNTAALPGFFMASGDLTPGSRYSTFVGQRYQGSITGELLTSADAGRAANTAIIKPLAVNDSSHRWRARPTAYIIPKIGHPGVASHDWAGPQQVPAGSGNMNPNMPSYAINYEALLQSLRDNHIEFYSIPAGSRVPVRQYYRVSGFNDAGANNSGATPPATPAWLIAGIHAEEYVTFTHGAYVVPLDQVAGAVAVLLFEPDNTNGSGFNSTVTSSLSSGNLEAENEGADGLILITHHHETQRYPYFRLERNMPRGVLPIITLSDPYLGLGLGDTATLGVNSMYGGLEITFSSSSSSIASVNRDGVVTGIAPGTAIITATTVFNGHTYTATSAVTVSHDPYTPVTGVTLDRTTLTLERGRMEILVATVIPANATNRHVTWSSNNANATVVGNLNTGFVTGVSTGSSVITVTTQAGNFTATCNVTVTAEVLIPTHIAVSPLSAVLYERDTLNLTATVFPSGVSQSVTWLSSNPNVATVSAGGVVTAIRGGTTQVKATAINGVSGFSSITVTGPREDPRVAARDIFGTTPPDGYRYATSPRTGYEMIATDGPIHAERGVWVPILEAPAGYRIVGVTPDSGQDYELRIVDGNLEARFSDDVSDIIVDVTMETVPGGVRSVVEFQFSAEVDAGGRGGSSGCNAGFLALGLLAIAPFVIRRRK